MRKKKDVLSVEAKQQGKSTKKNKGPDVSVEAKPPQISPAPPSGESQPQVNPIQIPPKVLEQAQALGIDLNQIIDWASSVEARLNAIQKEMPQQIQAAMEQAIANARQKAAAQQQQNPQGQDQGGGFGLQQLLPLLGGGGMDEEMLKLQKDMFSLNIESMKEDIGFTRAIKNALVQKIAGKAIGEVL